MIIDSSDVHSQHKFDLGQTEEKFYITLNPSSEVRKQRPSKVQLDLKDKLGKLPGQLQETGIIGAMGDDDELGSLFVDPIILLPKAEYVKLVIDARYLNSHPLNKLLLATRTSPSDYDKNMWEIIISKWSLLCISPSTS